jgi:nucleoside-diphosphate-sugar epimerase
MPLPALILTGASGLVGRHLLADLKNEYRIFAIARRSQRECGAPFHENIAWMRVDIGDREGLARTFSEIATAGGARQMIHLAAYYDFTGHEDEEYRRTNVEGTRNILDVAETLDLNRFVFASSVAACRFPRPEGAVTEATPPDGEHIYAWSKREGEAMVQARASSVPGCIVRFGAIYSDWCEYPPLYIFLSTWLSESIRSRLLAGRGATAIPYIHIQDVVTFMRSLLNTQTRLEPAEVLIASTIGCASHEELFQLATEYHFGRPRRPLLMPKALCGLGLVLMDLWGKVSGNPPFERPWMYNYIDRCLHVDNNRTRDRLDWLPNPRYRIRRRLRFLIEALKSEPVEWTARNSEAMRRKAVHADLVIYKALMEVEDQVLDSIVQQLRSARGFGAVEPFAALGRTEFEWFVRLLYRLIMNSVQSSNRMLILGYFEVTGRSRFEAGFTDDDLCLFLRQLGNSIMERLDDIDELKPFHQELHDRVTVPLEFGEDEIREQFERFRRGDRTPRIAASRDAAEARSVREQLEETIWRTLAQRK